VNNFKITIEHIQGIKHLTLNIENLNNGKIMCIVGKNGIGKTTLVKSIANLVRADIFKTTSSPYIFNASSKITYCIDGDNYIYTYNERLTTIDSKDIAPDVIINNIIGELPLPHGERFNFFQTIAKIDKDIRQKNITQDYKTPIKLVDWYKKIYISNKFDQLKEVDISGKKYYFLPQDDGKYIREDYFSSGEYFILSIYRLIQQRKKIIVIDELDISLDASAQVHLITELREFCREKSVTLLFTTHSLAIMKTLKDDELWYLENNNGMCEIEKRSYNHIKSILYQFKGWDKYILTEDKMLSDFIKWSLKDDVFYKKYIVIYIGAANSVVKLMDNNSREEFFSVKNNVISVLDGDQKNTYEGSEKVMFLPFDSIEKQLGKDYDDEDRDDDFFRGITRTKQDQKRGKDLFKKVKKKYTQDKIFEFVIKNNIAVVEQFKQNLRNFINQ